MQAVILAAGNSSRLYPYNYQHKSEITVCGKMLIEHTLLSLKKAGVKTVVIVISAQSTIPETLGNGSAYGVHITYATQQKALGMGHALLACKDIIEKEFFLLSGYHVNCADFLTDMQSKQKETQACIVLAKKSNMNDYYGNIVLEKDKLLQVREKPPKNEQTSYRLVSMYLLNTKFLDMLEATQLHENQFEEALSKYASQQDVRCLITQKETISLKYPWDLFSIKDYLLSLPKTFIAKTAQIGKNVVMTGNVVISDGAKIHEGVVIKGPCFIGRNVVVGNNAVLRNKVSVEEHATVGSSMEAKNTLFMKNCTTHSGFIGDSIIGEQTKIAAYVCTANARLDRESVKTVVKGEKVDTHLRHIGIMTGRNANLGVRVATMPGIIIGNNVTIGPSTTVMKNVDDNTRYYTKFAEIIEEVA